MKGFIEVTSRLTGLRILFPIDIIKVVEDDGNGKSSIEVGGDGVGGTVMYRVKENYDQIVDKIILATG